MCNGSLTTDSHRILQVDNGNRQEVVNCVLAYGKLGIKSSSDMFHLIDSKRVQWLLDHRQPQNIENY
jgi:hypothetical protein